MGNRAHKKASIQSEALNSVNVLPSGLLLPADGRPSNIVRTTRIARGLPFAWHLSFRNFGQQPGFKGAASSGDSWLSTAEG